MNEERKKETNKQTNKKQTKKQTTINVDFVPNCDVMRGGFR